MEPCRIDLNVLGTGNLADTIILELLPQDPPGALAERPAKSARRTLDHGDAATGGTRVARSVDPPSLRECFDRQGPTLLTGRKVERHVMADTASADDDDAFASADRAVQDARVANHTRIIAALYVDD